MRPTPASLALAAALLTACNPDGDSGFANQVTAYPDTTSDGPTTGDDSSSGAPPTPTTTGASDESTTTADDDETTAPVTTATTTTGDATTGDDITTTTATTTGDDDSTTTGEPVNPCPKIHIVVAPDEVANVRPTPATTMEPLGTLPPGALADVIAIVQGEAVDGNPEWYQIHTPGLDGYVWGGLVMCTMDQANMDGFFLPLACGNQVTISQGNNDGFSHNGKSAWAFDFSVGLGTPLVAIADGTVSHVYAGTKPGDPCYDGGGEECNNAANYVNLLHGDGTRSIYAHLSEPVVALGQQVTRGTKVGNSGSTGWSTGPHAHVARTENCNSPWCQSIPLSFTDVPGDGVPKPATSSPR